MLENKEIKLRALEASDLDRLFIWENNPEHWRVSHTIKPYSRQMLNEYIHSVNDIYTDKQLRLIIEEKETGKALGAVDLFECDFKNKKTGIGILIAEKEDHNKGYASQTLELLIPYCFDILSFHQIYCNVLTDNPASLALFEKYRFKKVGILKDWTYHNGSFYDEFLMQLINSNA